MSCPASYTGNCYCELENDLHSPRPRLVQGDYALVPLSHSHRADRPLSEYISDDSPFNTACTVRHRPILGGVADAAVIDRDGPFGHHSYYPRCRGLPQSCDDVDYLDLPDPNWRFSHTYPLPCMEAGRVRWGPDQIRAYNRDVLRHNNQIARRKAVGVPGEYMMLHPTMDLQGRFPPGFDRPMRVEDFFGLDEPLIDSHRQHYGLPAPENLERLLHLSSTEQHLRRQVKQIQLLEYYGARRLAEQFGMQLLAAQNALPCLATPRLGHGLGPDFDECYLSPLTRNLAGGAAGGGMMPLEAMGYGSGLGNWNLDALQMMAGGGGAPGPSWSGRPGMGLFPGMGMGMTRGHSFPSSTSSWPGLPYHGAGAGGGWGWAGGGGGGRGPRNIDRVMESIGCDGGVGSRSRRFR